jgi:pSer/pThr/pTyr-binding forkhead associated (FHA) protein
MPFLVVLEPYESQRFDLKKGTNVIGRNPECDIVFSVSAVSREHARIMWRNNQFFLEDLKSRNLTILNDVKVEAEKPMQLHSGDNIKIGEFYCQYVDETAPKLADIDTPDWKECEGVWYISNRGPISHN